jgi:hypothetical protein
MQTTHGILSSTHLEAPHYSSPGLTYTRLMQSSTRLHPERQPYITQRMVNQVEGASLRRELQAGEHAMDVHMGLLQRVGREAMGATRMQSLNMQCGSLYK